MQIPEVFRKMQNIYSKIQKKFFQERRVNHIFVDVVRGFYSFRYDERGPHQSLSDEEG
jgi:hypothetical protein